MGDNFDFKKFLMENRLGAYSKAGNLSEHNYPDDAPGRVRGAGYDGMMLNAGRPGEYMEYTVTGQSSNLDTPPVKFTLADIPEKNIININGEYRLDRSAIKKAYETYGEAGVTIKGNKYWIPKDLLVRLFGSRKQA